METLLSGLPKSDTGNYPTHLASDSEAALSISRMTGPLRRVRHLELRHRYLQELVHSERLVLSFISGEYNHPADGLTNEEDFAELRDRNEELDEVTEKLETLPENLVKYAQVARDLALGLVPVLVVEVWLKCFVQKTVLCAKRVLERTLPT
eukprot:s1495_g1.t1